MELNTKQVRAIVNNIAGFGATYTDRTLKSKAQKANKRRTVVWVFYSMTEANEAYKKVQEVFAKMGATNKVTRTGTEVNMWTHSGGFEYVRVIADIA